VTSTPLWWFWIEFSRTVYSCSVALPLSSHLVFFPVFSAPTRKLPKFHISFVKFLHHFFCCFFLSDCWKLATSTKIWHTVGLFFWGRKTNNPFFWRRKRNNYPEQIFIEQNFEVCFTSVWISCCVSLSINPSPATLTESKFLWNCRFLKNKTDGQRPFEKLGTVKLKPR